MTTSTTTVRNPSELQRRIGGPRIRALVPYVVLLISCLVTGAVAVHESVTTRTRARIRFNNAVEDARSLITNTVDTHIALLRGTDGFLATKTHVNRAAFDKFVGALELPEHYKAIQGIGFSKLVHSADIPALEMQMKREGVSWFHVWPKEASPERQAIIYFSPLTANSHAALGYDMASEATRQSAMNRARDTGMPVASGRVVLVLTIQGKRQVGFLVFVPFYNKPAETLKTVQERRKALVGFVYSVFRSHDFFSQTLAAGTVGDLDISVYDLSKSGKRLELYDSATRRHFKQPQYRPLFQTTQSLEVAGSVWQIQFRTTPDFDAGVVSGRESGIVLVGLALSILLFYLTGSLVKAEALAEQIAASLKRSEQAVREANERIAGILQSITDAFVSVDSTWRIVYVNERAAQIASGSANGVLGRLVWDVYPEILGTNLERMLRTAMERKSQFTLEFCNDQTMQWLEVRCYPGSGGLSVYLTDITDRKREEQQLEERYQEEHRVSVTLQHALLATDPQYPGGIVIEPYYKPAFREAFVGGDFYDIFEPSEGRMAIVIGDVAGKGVNAAVRTATAKNALRALAYEDSSPASVLTRLNRVINREMQEGFVTAFYGVLDLQIQEFVFANAGHEPPLWLIPDRDEVLEIERPGTVLGVDPEAVYQQSRIELAPGHKLFFYTDGITEARCGVDFFGVERLKALLLEHRFEDARQIVTAITDEILSYSEGKLHDDVAALLLSILT
ncbi:MAG: SpoIIE family protein phosphatase [Armatimonadetes bacterium]|nr:SpoIIE family protein phosphatase [Armatimonadota bacterium]